MITMTIYYVINFLYFNFYKYMLYYYDYSSIINVQSYAINKFYNHIILNSLLMDNNINI